MKYIEFYHEIGKEAVFNVDQLFHGHVMAFKVGIMSYMITVWLIVNNVYPISVDLALFFKCLWPIERQDKVIKRVLDVSSIL